MKIGLVVLVLGIGVVLFTFPTSVEARMRTYSQGGRIKVQKGYLKRGGKYVAPHLKTHPDQYLWNNLKY